MPSFREAVAAVNTELRKRRASFRQLSMEEKPQNTVWLPTQEAATEQLGAEFGGRIASLLSRMESEGRARIALKANL
ncbi:hypothetical protein D3H35_25305 [Cohnella faecalis]|uniref:Uncharacterized protein n=1 Tax=Cohnella faecalis TaxID=2315694 RepID=A0A398CPL5_9BACL|nr:hypothetical protein D3H35_25305 [Cohnella faecalis]